MTNSEKETLNRLIYKLESIEKEIDSLTKKIDDSSGFEIILVKLEGHVKGLAKDLEHLRDTTSQRHLSSLERLKDDLVTTNKNVKKVDDRQNKVVWVIVLAVISAILAKVIIK